jgi:hypothetical protein
MSPGFIPLAVGAASIFSGNTPKQTQSSIILANVADMAYLLFEIENFYCKSTSQ